MRKFLYTLLLLAVALPASGYGHYWVDGICYNHLGNNQVEVVETSNGSYSGMMVIPKVVTIRTISHQTGTYGDPVEMVCEVKAIGSWAFSDCTGLTGIVLPSSIESIGAYAFNGCTSLASVTLSNGLRSIGNSAFKDCSALTSIVLPNSVTTMAWGAFYGCSSLTSVTLSKSLTAINGAFFGCSSLTAIDIPSSVTVLDGSFEGCTQLASVTMPKSLTRIGERTFNNCSALTHIDLPNSVTEIGRMAFAYCGLTSLELPETVISLDTYAFYGSTSLASVTVRAVTPPSMVEMNAFSDDTYGLVSLKVPEISLSAYQSTDWWNQFQNMMADAALNTPYDFEVGGIYYVITGVNTVNVTYRDLGYNSYNGVVTIPASVNHNGVAYTVTGIGNSAFRACTSLTGVTLPSSVTCIGEYAFYGDSGLTGIDFPTGLTDIGSSAFENCTGITSLTIPASVAAIGEGAFTGVSVTSLIWNARNCWTNGDMNTSLINQVTIGNEVTVLPAKFAFRSSITAVDLPQSLVTIGENAFNSCSGLSTLTIPVNVSSIGENAFYGTGVSSLTWNARECWTVGNTTYWRNYFVVSQVTIGDEVEVLPAGFLAMSRIESVTIPNSVKTIGDYAFYECDSLTSLVIPESVQNIGACSVAYCGKLNSLVVGKGLAGVDESSFEGLWSLTELTWNPKHCESGGSLSWSYNIDELTIGEEVEVIPNNFLYASGIRSLVIPASVKSIGESAFHEHYSLETIVVDPANSVYDSRDNCNILFKTANDSIVLTCKNSILPNGITEISDYAFYRNNSLTTFDVPSTVVRIGKYAFSECDSLVSLTIPDGVTTIGLCCFSGCNLLESVDLPDALTAISEGLFSFCPKLKRVDIPNSVSDMANAAFDGCRSLEHLTLPDGIPSIQGYTFRNCTNLEDINIPNSVTSIGDFAFYNCNSLTGISIPSQVSDIATQAFANCASLSSITVDAGNAVYDSRDNCNAIIKTANNTLMLGCKNTVIPQTVTTIGYYSFQGCTDLKSISIPNSVTSIGSDAFYGCTGLKSITLPASVRTIGSYAFYNCTGVTTVTSFATTPPTLNYRALETCYNRAVLRVPNEALAAYQAANYWKQFSRIVPFIGAGPGDVDGDGVINVQDVTGLIDMLLSGEVLPPYVDVDGDGQVNIKDITDLIDLLLNNP